MMAVPKTAALPLGYFAITLFLTTLEPTGIEPVSFVCKTNILPLNYDPFLLCGGLGSNQHNEVMSLMS
jgi:hypothetical protein